jgi:glycosyltransferase involved in cell wall biosynthesis
MRVVLVSPTCADTEIAQGGGERYVEELAKALAEKVETRLVSFGRERKTERPKPGLERVILKSWTRDPLTPFAPGLRKAIRGFDVVHCFQYYTLPTFLACFFGHRQGSRVFVTDLGGGGWTPGYQIDQSRWIDGHFPISKYAATMLPRGRPKPVHVIYGGVDLDKFKMREKPEHDGSVAFVGRLLPHKGVHFLIDAMPPDRTLHLIGPVADKSYLADLHHRARGKRIEFHHGLCDSEMVGHLQRAMVYVHPTPLDDQGSAGVHELLGLAVLEAMACGAPVLAPNVGSLSELGAFESADAIEPNDTASISEGLNRLASVESGWNKISLSGRMRVEEQFTWQRAVSRLLDALEYT